MAPRIYGCSLFTSVSSRSRKKVSIKITELQRITESHPIFCELDAGILPLTFGKTSLWFFFGNHFRHPPKGILWIDGATFWEHTGSITLLHNRTKEKGNHLPRMTLTMVAPNIFMYDFLGMKLARQKILGIGVSRKCPSYWVLFKMLWLALTSGENSLTALPWLKKGEVYKDIVSQPFPPYKSYLWYYLTPNREAGWCGEGYFTETNF